MVKKIACNGLELVLGWPKFEATGRVCLMACSQKEREAAAKARTFQRALCIVVVKRWAFDLN